MQLQRDAAAACADSSRRPVDELCCTCCAQAGSYQLCWLLLVPFVNYMKDLVARIRAGPGEEEEEEIVEDDEEVEEDEEEDYEM